MAEPWTTLRRGVIDADLCTRCGSCCALGGGSVTVPDPLGSCLPALTGPAEAVDPAAVEACSGAEVDIPTLNDWLFGRQPESYLLGVYRSLAIAHATDPAVRRGGASGGILSAALCWLLETGRIEGAWVQAMDPDRPWFPRSYLATTREDILASAQSKYVISPHHVGLDAIDPDGGPLAYVGLPCQVHSIRKLQRIDHPLTRRFKYVLGPYCGNILHFSSTRDFLARYGVTDLQQVESLAFRAGEWPGKMRVELIGGRVIEMPKFHANYLIPFHIMRRCLLCSDLANDLADLAGGDAWAPVYEQRGKGFSLMVARTDLGAELADAMRKDGTVWAEAIDFDAAVAMHSHGLDLKKRGSFLRIDRRVRLGLAGPKYGYRLAPGVPLSRRVMEAVMGTIFRICWTPLARNVMQAIPNRWIGWLFEKARTRWKGATRATKRTGLGTIRFQADPPRRSS
jgi:coenzyme F420 hydrogenase subunit beta